MKGLILLSIAILAVIVSGQRPQRYQFKNSKSDSSSSSDESSKDSHSQSDSDIITLAQFNANKKAYAKKLQTDGIWMDWKANNPEFLPWEAVYAGYSANDTFFVMRAYHVDDNGTTIGKLVGKYSPNMKLATISYKGKEYPKNNIEILLHSRLSWSYKSDDRELFPSIVDKEISTKEYICRSQFAEDFEYWIPGGLDEGSDECKISNNGVETFQRNYQTLRKSCRTKESVDNSNHVPITLSIEELEDEQYGHNMNENGLWINWNTKKVGVPENAVFGGRNKDGPMFLITAEHNTDLGVFIGRIPGVYWPNLRKAYIEYDGQIFGKDNFAILLHNNYNFVPQDEAVNSTMITIGNNYGFCQSPSYKGTVWNLGRLDFKTGVCTVAILGDILVIPNGYRVLQNAC